MAFAAIAERQAQRHEGDRARQMSADSIIIGSSSLVDGYDSAVAGSDL